jgi:hypothetical protein
MVVFKEPCPKEQGMNIQAKLLCAVAAAGFATLAATSSAQALNTLECSVEVSCRQARRYAQRPEMERFP